MGDVIETVSEEVPVEVPIVPEKKVIETTGEEGAPVEATVVPVEGGRRKRRSLSRKLGKSMRKMSRKMKKMFKFGGKSRKAGRKTKSRK